MLLQLHSLLYSTHVPLKCCLKCCLKRCLECCHKCCLKCSTQHCTYHLLLLLCRLLYCLLFSALTHSQCHHSWRERTQKGRSPLYALSTVSYVRGHCSNTQGSQLPCQCREDITHSWWSFKCNKMAYQLVYWLSGINRLRVVLSAKLGFHFSR